MNECIYVHIYIYKDYIHLYNAYVSFGYDRTPTQELLLLGPSGCSPRAKERRKGAGFELNQWYDSGMTIRQYRNMMKYVETWTPGNYKVDII
jgi:hypothetical protein